MAASVLGMAFIPYYNHMVQLLETNQELKKTARGIFKQIAWGAGGTLAGGLVGGPVGGLVLGFAGLVIGYWMSDEYQSLVTTIKGLSDQDKKRLVDKVQKLVGSSGIEALGNFIGTRAHQKIFLNVLNKFIQDRKGG